MSEDIVEAFRAHLASLPQGGHPCECCGHRGFTLRAINRIPGTLETMTFVIAACDRCGCVRQFDAARFMPVERRPMVMMPGANGRRG
jgi:hypothetical protein